MSDQEQEQERIPEQGQIPMEEKAPEDPEAEHFTVHVGNLSYSVTEEDLREVFQECGEVTGARIPVQFDGRSKGFGFVEFSTDEACGAAIEKFDNQDFKGRRLRVERAIHRGAVSSERRPPRRDYDRPPPRRRDYDDYDRPPRRGYDDYDRPPPRRRDYDDYDRPPRRGYDDYDRPPRRGYDDYDRPPRRDYRDYDRPPPRRRDYDDYDRPPRRSYDDNEGRRSPEP